MKTIENDLPFWFSDNTVYNCARWRIVQIIASSCKKPGVDTLLHYHYSNLWTEMVRSAVMRTLSENCNIKLQQYDCQ